MHNPSVLVICGPQADQQDIAAVESAATIADITPTLIEDWDNLAKDVIARHINGYDAVIFMGAPSISMEQTHDDHPRLTIVALGPFPADESTIGIYLANEAIEAFRHITQESGRRVTADHMLTRRIQTRPSILATA